jgi:hypothetical protein
MGFERNGSLSSSSRHDQAFSIGTSFRRIRDGEMRAEGRPPNEVERREPFSLRGPGAGPPEDRQEIRQAAEAGPATVQSRRVGAALPRTLDTCPILCQTGV